ncbi:ribosome maturation factor RimM [bacterium]|nr:ribosome maturation factor RimM [bacterium]
MTRRLIPLARVTKTQGLKGEFRAQPAGGESENLETIKRVYLRDEKALEDAPDRAGARAYTVERARGQRSFYVIKLVGVDSIDAAQELVGKEICAQESDLTPLPEGEYYWYQLVGLAVHDANGAAIGRVTRLFPTGANDVLVVQTDAKPTREIFVPYTDHAVARVNLERGVIELTSQPGLLDEE